MKLVACYIVSERERLSTEDANYLVGMLIMSSKMEVDMSQCQATITTPINDPEDFSEFFEGFIKYESGGRYDDKHMYEWLRFHFRQAEGGQRVSVAMIFEGMDKKLLHPDISEFLERGTAWEMNGRWGDAALCYLMARRIYPDDLQLSFRLGRCFLHSPLHAGKAYPLLLEASDRNPCSSECAEAMGDLYLAMADNPKITVSGCSRDQLLEYATVHFERAEALDPSNTTRSNKRMSLQERLGLAPEMSFFHKGLSV